MNKINTLLIILASIFITIPVFSQTWESLGNPTNSGGTLITKYNERLFTTGFYLGPLFYKDSDTAEWTSTNWPASGNTINGLCMHNRYLYAMGTNSYYRSSDNGDTWEDLNQYNPIQDGEVGSLISKGGNLFVCAFGGGIFKSSDDGMTWESLENNFGDSSIDSFYLFNYKIIDSPIGILIANFYGIAISIDDGASFQILKEDEENFYNDVDYLNGAIYAISNQGGLFKSIDGGATWTTNHSIVQGKSIYVNENRIFIGGKTELYYSDDDDGQTWVDIYQSNIGEYIFGIFELEGNVYVSTFLNGAFKSTDYLGVEDLTYKDFNVSITPNPVNDVFSIVGSESEQLLDETIYIFNTNGRKVKSIVVDNLDNINISDLSSGVYIVSFVIKNKTMNLKLIKI